MDGKHLAVTCGALLLALAGCVPQGGQESELPTNHAAPSIAIPKVGLPEVETASIASPDVALPTFFSASCFRQPPRELARLYHKAGQAYVLVTECELASQGFCESSWRTDVVSSTGDIGVAQFQQRTADELGIDPLDPEQAIDAQGRFLEWSKRRWDPPGAYGRTREDLDAIGYATYQRGIGTMRKDQAARGWTLPRDAIGGWPAITGHYIRCITGDETWRTDSDQSH